MNTKLTRQNMDDAIYALWSIVSSTESGAIAHLNYDHLRQNMFDIASSCLERVGSTEEEFIILMQEKPLEEDEAYPMGQME